MIAPEGPGPVPVNVAASVLVAAIGLVLIFAHRIGAALVAFLNWCDRRAAYVPPGQTTTEYTDAGEPVGVADPQPSSRKRGARYDD